MDHCSLSEPLTIGDFKKNKTKESPPLTTLMLVLSSKGEHTLGGIWQIDLFLAQLQSLSENERLSGKAEGLDSSLGLKNNDLTNGKMRTGLVCFVFFKKKEMIYKYSVHFLQ